ncbi:hypothetical protein C731_3396 [Mycolicibacterium hassiacum DSM 44199]|uniref:Uncharacterized protein n=1 Tax=Mycolicibacterium hassiacum (strain DSM 44199 / CIP 105218 / JCM 12690 / 3849) TaxID=1122247 RepID=K5BEW4_MYCHD|nr:hypothetical protein [Mycolicibacterium hassiacum]EKF22656.1 hypothetical protein C731_3396 [Mycolicibacterium hassiacum DSM 44199]MDA4088831.1 hypothetical protein [Mycolicibacterium hassiacum DSM 44199]PZN16388.1 MAG: hypothetical protein DIU75_19905 [Mycolicibacterium hassiacum]
MDVPALCELLPQSRVTVTPVAATIGAADPGRIGWRGDIPGSLPEPLAEVSEKHRVSVAPPSADEARVTGPPAVEPRRYVDPRELRW